LLASRSLSAKQYMIFCYLIGQVTILAWLYPPPHKTQGIYIQLLDLVVLFAATAGIVYEWFKVLPRVTIKQAALFMLSIVIQVVELFALAFYLIVSFNPTSFVVPGRDQAAVQPFRYGYEFLYYSITTFTGTGYGDVTPASGLAKEFASCEMLVGWIMSTLMMALLGSKISQYFFQKRNGEKP
jgi:hypothetical protein